MAVMPGLSRRWVAMLGPVVRKPINANPGLKINQGSYFCAQTLINAGFLQNFRLGKVNPEKQKAAKTTFIQKLKTATKVYANPRLC